MKGSVAPSIWGMSAGLSSIVVGVEVLATVSRPPDGADSGLALTGELTSSAHDLPEAGWKVCAAAFIPGVFVVESSGFVTRSAKELLLVAAAGGVFSSVEDIVQVGCKQNDQVVAR